MKFFKLGAAGRIRIKGEEFAPKDWKRSLWDKLIKNDLFTPININNEENIKEVKIFFNKKVFVIGINLFLFSFLYSFAKDSYSILVARHNITSINQINFEKQIPVEFINENNKLILDYNLNKNKELKKQIEKNNSLIKILSSNYKNKFWNDNVQIIKSTIWPLANDLLILWMIFKYYLKRKNPKFVQST
jgi:hypothetical protein